jgi:hypothetical protein
VLAVVTDSVELPLAIVGGAALLFLLAPWRFGRSRAAAPPPPPPPPPRRAVPTAG